jgi:hypothetical protein
VSREWKSGAIVKSRRQKKVLIKRADVGVPRAAPEGGSAA